MTNSSPINSYSPQTGDTGNLSNSNKPSSLLDRFGQLPIFLKNSSGENTVNKRDELEHKASANSALKKVFSTIGKGVVGTLSALSLIGSVVAAPSAIATFIIAGVGAGFGGLGGTVRGLIEALVTQKNIGDTVKERAKEGALIGVGVGSVVGIIINFIPMGIGIGLGIGGLKGLEYALPDNSQAKELVKHSLLNADQLLKTHLQKKDAKPSP